MKKKSSFRSTLFYLRVLVGFTFCLIGFFLALFAFGGLIGWPGKLQAASPIQIGRGPPNIQVVRPIKVNKDLRELSYITPYAPGIERPELRRYPPGTGTPLTAKAMTPIAPQPAAPGVNIGFDGIDRNASGCNCSPPDTQGDVGPNYYIQNVNSTTFRIWDKAGTVLITSTLNTLWGTGGTNPCTQGEHFGDPFVFWDPIADRWVLTDFAFAFSGGASQPPYYECIAVSQTNNPVSGGWYLYAVQADTTNTDWLNDYPKFGMWPDAWYSSYNMFCANGKSHCANGDAANTFEGVQVNAWNRTQMLAGAAMSTIFFRLSPAAVGDSYSFLPATYRFGAPPAGRNEFYAAIDSPPSANALNTLNTVHIWKFHVDFVTPPNATMVQDNDITVNGFTDAWDSTENTDIVPQSGTTTKLDTVGDRLFTALWYQNLGGTESLWAVHTINDTSIGPTAVRWYQFNVTGNTVSTTPVQQGDINGSGDGLYRWMPSLTVDKNGNMAIGYSASSSSVFPSIRYNGRLTTDTLGTLGQGESILIAGTGAFTGSSRWGDYSYSSVDPTDGCTFWHTNEYLTTTGSNWMTRVGNFAYSQCAGTGTLTGTVTNASTSAPVSGATVTAGSNTTTTNASGVYMFSGITAGTYNVTASATNFTTQTQNGVVVNSGGTTTQNFALVSTPQCGGANVWCSVTGTTGNIAWSSAATWDKGTVPASGADVIIRPFTGTYSTSNFVALNGNATPNSITIQTNANAGIGGSSGTETFTVAGDFTIQSGGLLRDVLWTGAAQDWTLKVAGNFTNSGTMGGVSTGAKYTVALQFNGTGAQTVGGSGGITALGGNSSPSTAITISNTSLSGVTFGANVNTTNGGGVNATTTVNANALVKFSSSRIQFTGGGSLTFNGLTELQAATFNSHYAMIGTKTIGTGSTITYKNSASTITPTTDIPSATLGNLAIDVGAGSATLGNTITISGNLTLASGTLSAGANNINLAGNWANAGGMFSGGTGTVTLNGTNQSITGSTTFNNLTKQVNTARTLTFDSTGTQTITGTMTLQGVSAQLLSLRSSNNGSQWTIDPQGARTIAFLDVKDSDNINATAINAVGTNSVDSGNNTNWVFIPVTSVDSVMTHGIGGTSFPVHLLVPIGSPPGIECRSSTSQGAGNYTMVFTFPNNLTSVAGATVTGHNPSTAHGMVSTSGIDSNDSHNYIVNLTGVSDQQYLAVTLNSVVDAAGNAGNVTGPKMGILIGDVDASGRVDSTDVFQVRQQTLQNANSSNFRMDVDASGRIDSTDVFITRQQTLTALP